MAVAPNEVDSVFGNGLDDEVRTRRVEDGQKHDEPSWHVPYCRGSSDQGQQQAVQQAHEGCRILQLRSTARTDWSYGTLAQFANRSLSGCTSRPKFLRESELG